ncbi:hypothetical protein MLD38_036657 [Melastoma candidum]|uniref:Uncharacterized protein n=1 Tax=Melastoma candidum TaxID=119954 RepID=A0ACB9LK78_9MYRT|nr:hypothetical protein MLD38_036657 [Melastoma candidum]
MTKGLAQEKQITIDPASFISTRDEDFHVHLPPLPPARSKFLSHSLPSSATSSPRFTSTFLKKNKKRSTEDDNSQNLCHMPSPYMAMRSDLARSKSCGEGRTSAPSVDFDIVPLHPVHAFPKPFIPTKLLDHRSTSPTPGGIHIEEDDMGLDRLDSKEQEQEFKCGALCLFLPGFGKAKAIKGKRDGQADDAVPTVTSRTVSLEKFECGSWASVGINKNDNSGELPSSGNLYFDLPLELIRGIKNDTNHPVTAAFVFDKDLKGVLRNGTRSSSWRRPSQQGSPPRHVRFSTSSQPASPAASCVTPRLQKARAEFLAFLEEQST